MAEFSSTEDITFELTNFIQQAEVLSGLNNQEKISSNKKQKDIFSLHQKLNATLSTTSPDERMKSENIVNEDIINMISGFNVYTHNNQIVDMQEVNRISWFCPKKGVEEIVLEEAVTSEVNAEKLIEEILEDFPESEKSGGNGEEERSEDRLKENTYVGESSCEILVNSVQGNPENINKMNSVNDLKSLDVSIDPPKESLANISNILQKAIPEESELLSSVMIDVINSNQTLSEVIKADPEPTTPVFKNKHSLLKRFFRSKKGSLKIPQM